MCVNDYVYKKAVADKKDADDEIKRCNEGLNYFNGWLPKVSSCIDCLEQMITQTKAIGAQCAEIIINGKPIDQGARHYPNGGAMRYASYLTGAKSRLESLKTHIQKSIDDLTTSKEDAEKKRKNAVNTMNIYPAPCGVCVECNPPVVVSTGSGTTAMVQLGTGCTGNRTVSTTTTSSST